MMIKKGKSIPSIPLPPAGACKSVWYMVMLIRGFVDLAWSPAQVFKKNAPCQKATGCAKVIFSTKRITT